MLRRTIITLVLTLFAASVWGQDYSGAGGKDTSLVLLRAADLCPSYQVDSRIVGNNTLLQQIMDSVQRVQPNAYPLMAQWCRQQNLRINRMIRSLTNDYESSQGVIWMDSMHCITDADE